MSKPISLLWFRQDLRLQDNPALRSAASQRRILPVYILDDKHAGEWSMGAASRWWLHQSLNELNKQLQGKLLVLAGDPVQLLPELVQTHAVESVFWNRCYEPWRIKRDSAIKSRLEASGVNVESCNGSLIWEPWTTRKADDTPYKVFTPFYKNAVAKGVQLNAVLGAAPKLQLYGEEQGEEQIAELGLLPNIKWYEQFSASFTPGEVGAQQKLTLFTERGLSNYRQGRDFPSLENVSRLSPHLHFGEIAPHRVWQEVAASGDLSAAESETEHFHRELGWREFSYSLLFHFQDLTHKNMNPRFDDFPWLEDQALLQKWQQGMTGYPLVDAGMRELWTTGYMHNRVRMIVGSFLVKNLMQHWRHGAQWFWDCLLDADLPNNTCSWQWVAGCGADAAPYFRVFNPLTQSVKFDAAGYIRRHVPELAKLSDKQIHEPAAMSTGDLAAAGVILGENYPHPVVDLKESRERALAAYKSLQVPG